MKGCGECKECCLWDKAKGAAEPVPEEEHICGSEWTYPPDIFTNKFWVCRRCLGIPGHIW